MSEKYKPLQIPAELHTRVKLKATEQEITLREAAKISLTAFVEGKI